MSDTQVRKESTESDAAARADLLALVSARTARTCSSTGVRVSARWSIRTQAVRSAGVSSSRAETGGTQFGWRIACRISALCGMRASRPDQRTKHPKLFAVMDHHSAQGSEVGGNRPCLPRSLVVRNCGAPALPV